MTRSDPSAPVTPTDAADTPPRGARLRRRWVRRLLWTLVLLSLGAVVGATVDEAKTSRLQARYLAEQAQGLHYSVQPGPSPALRYPGDGPYDLRLGYHALPGFLSRLQAEGWRIDAQARASAGLRAVQDRGLFTPYDEKNQAGLSLLDCHGATLHQARQPERVLGDFDAIAPLIVNTLLFIEDRDLLEGSQPRLNPAVNWGRFLLALSDQARSWIDPEHEGPGGSTLATQIEKYRHSPGGRTATGRDKLTQMASASLRAYLDGELNLPRRRQIVVSYLDTVPLAARPGFGEVHGLGDALWAWYGRDVAEVNRLLQADGRDGDFPPAPLGQRALAYKQVLSLLIAQRRPSFYLGSPDTATGLRALADAHLRVLADAGVITATLRDAALPLPLHLLSSPMAAASLVNSAPFSERKAATALRSRLASVLGMDKLYDLDRLDLQASSSIDGQVQQAGVALLRSLATPEGAKAAGLYGPYLLQEGDDPRPLTFSFTLFERGEHVNRLRVQTDNLDQPFDINEGARLDLGSTAKLRTLITYLGLVAELHARWRVLDTAQLAGVDVDERDALGQWVLASLQRNPGLSLPDLLEAAMARTYSASPAEGFFTGGGLHHFNNFEAADNTRVLSVREATTRSVNLVYIRLMRDLVRHLMFHEPGTAAALRAPDDDPARQALLARFANKEGQQFLRRFDREYRGLSPDAAVGQLLGSRRATPARLAALFGELERQGDAAALDAFIRQHLPDSELSAAELASLFQRYGAGQMNLADRGYVASVHPLALWLAGQLRHAPTLPLSQLLASSEAQRQAVYVWLFKTRHRSAQDQRIRSLLEIDAFKQIHQRWQRLGYPFDQLTPSYASAIGASGDRPSALAELMGIIVNDGQRKPVARLESMVFAQDTPYETRLSLAPRPSEQVMDPEVVKVVRQALIGVVEDGTARRLSGVFTQADGSPIAVGGKTGTGDHRYDTFGRGGQLISSRVVSRSATLMFLIGERYYGTMMVFVGEPEAEKYRFTSALPTQLLKAMAPTLQPLLGARSCN
jgi:membrane peptidoglycan carboxypeptidase